MSFKLNIKILLPVIILLFTLLGCSRPLVKQDGAQMGGPDYYGKYTGIPVQEGELQALQAELRTIYFDFDKYALSSEAQQAAEFNSQVLKRVPHLKIVAEGHCDERGTAEYNLALGERRARSTVEYLSALGIEPHRLSTVSYGSELPVDPGHNEAAWAKNRRVYLRVAK
jgi:peptidoglycan-associated lipoprotein